MLQEDMYVVMTFEKQRNEWQVCYQHNVPFVGTYDEAKVAQKELQEWMPEGKYVIFKLVEA